MVQKLKTCSGCKKLRAIWGKSGKELYCKYCWNKQFKKGIDKAIKAYKPIKYASTKQEKLNKAYTILRRSFMENHPYCQVKFPGCTGKSEDCHHSHGRGKYMLDESTFIATCRFCHNFIHSHADLARELGFLK